jgi:hypothetical protein
VILPSANFIQNLILSNQIFLPPAYSPALIYFWRERVWRIICNYPTVLKEKNINRKRKSTIYAICWLKSVLHEEKRREQENRWLKSVLHQENSRERENHNDGRSPTLWFSCSRRFSSCITDFSQHTAQVVLFLFLFMFFSYTTVV